MNHTNKSVNYHLLQQHPHHNRTKFTFDPLWIQKTEVTVGDLELLAIDYDFDFSFGTVHVPTTTFLQGKYGCYYHARERLDEECFVVSNEETIRKYAAAVDADYACFIDRRGTADDPIGMNRENRVHFYRLKSK